MLLTLLALHAAGLVICVQLAAFDICSADWLSTFHET